MMVFRMGHVEPHKRALGSLQVQRDGQADACLRGHSAIPYANKKKTGSVQNFSHIL